jgi:UDP:flavonoid glycosyltransferase YjiC (YdhE family)
MSGAGTQLLAKRLAPERLRAKVHQAIACRTGATRIADAFRAAGGPAAAADAIERRLLHPRVASNPMSGGITLD